MIKEYLFKLLHDQQSVSWLREKSLDLQISFEAKKLFIAFSQAARHFSRTGLIISPSEFEEGLHLRQDWHLASLNIQEIARIILLLSIPQNDPESYHAAIEKLARAADMHELSAIYKSFPVLSFPEMLIDRAAEGVRSNIKGVFESIAMNNPFPADYFKENAWNQMVLKAVFNGSFLFKIVGIDNRANHKLASTLSDYAHERWAAGRTVNPELWRLVGPFMDHHFIEDMERLFTSDNIFDKKAAALAIGMNHSFDVGSLQNRNPFFCDQIKNGKLTWDKFSEEWYSSLKIT